MNDDAFAHKPVIKCLISECRHYIRCDRCTPPRLSVDNAFKFKMKNLCFARARNTY